MSKDMNKIDRSNDYYEFKCGLKIARVAYAVKHNTQDLYYHIEGVRLMCNMFDEEEHLMDFINAVDLYTKIKKLDKRVVIMKFDYDKGKITVVPKEEIISGGFIDYE